MSDVGLVLFPGRIGWVSGKTGVGFLRFSDDGEIDGMKWPGSGSKPNPNNYLSVST